MKVQLMAGLICECGHVMMTCNRPDQDSAMCVHEGCEHYEKKFSIPTVELQEAPSEWEALMTR